ncbi:MFS transporter [Myxococcota bacterium]|nr:MFS transporter [Myxococcota bacterium]MBU1430938.1 MFS transporter [Myxococcota bacterium]MBU1899531.1 MFS transporter [Myxococcota bacterium]
MSTHDYSRAERIHTILAACLGWLFSAMDTVLLLLLRGRIEADLGVSAATLDAAIGAGLLFSAIGAVLFAQLGDRFGRARMLGVAILIYSVATGAMAFSWDAWSLISLRALSGIGTGGEWSLGFALISEVWRAEKRGAMGGLVQSMFNVGTLLGITLAVTLGHRWRVVFGLATLPALALVYIRLHVPESRLWLAMRAAMAAGQAPPQLHRPPLRAIFEGPLRAVTLKAAVIFTLMNYAFFMFGAQITPFVTAPLSAGGLGWSQQQAGPIFGVTTIMAGLSAVAMGALSDRFGRRRVFSALCLFGALAFAAFYLVLPSLSPTQMTAFWVALVAVGAGYGINGVVGALFSELYPTHLRATGPGFVSNVGKALAAGAPLLSGWIIRAFEDPRLGFAVGLSAPAVAYLLLAGLIWTLPRVTGRGFAPVEASVTKPERA